MHSRIAIAGVITALVLPLTTATAVSAHGHDQLPETIDLPAGFVGEGVAVGAHNTFYGVQLPTVAWPAAICATG